MIKFGLHIELVYILNILIFPRKFIEHLAYITLCVISRFVINTVTYVSDKINNDIYFEGRCNMIESFVSSYIEYYNFSKKVHQTFNFISATSEFSIS